ncbi:hypothetical protein SK128_018206, partial [Halocaridina rubra]
RSKAIPFDACSWARSPEAGPVYENFNAYDLATKTLNNHFAPNGKIRYERTFFRLNMKG